MSVPASFLDSLEPEMHCGDAAEFSSLASLPAAEYDRQREAKAKELKIRVSTLDAEVEKLRALGARKGGLLLSMPEPWAHPVNGADVLDDIADQIKRYIAVPDASRHATALWILMTYVIGGLFIAPMLVITSPQKRCGKSTLLILLRKMCLKALLVASTSPAALFRIVELHHPTLLLDEADAWAKDNDDLRGVINAGHSRETAQILRCDGDDHEPRVFDLFCPKAIAGIGSLADTIRDRAVIVEMKRRGPSEQIEQLRLDRLDLSTIQSMAVRWAADQMEAVGKYDAAVPTELHDRAADNWRPLIAIADLAGGEWPKRARSAAIALSARDNDDDDIKVLLLGDIRQILSAAEGGRVPSHDLVAQLAAIEDRPWSEWKVGRPMTTVQLARQLKPFGIATKNIKVGLEKVVKAYFLDSFTDTFTRYLKLTDSAATLLPAGNSKDEFYDEAATAPNPVAARSATAASMVAGRMHLNGQKTSVGSGVADQNVEMEVFTL